MQRGEALDHGHQGCHHLGTPQNEDVVLPSVLDDLLNLFENALDQGVVDGQGADRLLKFDAEFEQSGLVGAVGAGDIFLIFEEALVELLAEHVQFLF